MIWIIYRVYDVGLDIGKEKNEFASRWKRRMIYILGLDIYLESVKIENFCTLLEEFILRHFVTYSLGISHS